MPNTYSACALSLGSIAADFQMRVPRPPEESTTMLASEFTRVGGGKAANVALAARRLGISARLFGNVGDDDLAEQALEPLRKAGVDLNGVRRVAGQATAVAIVSVPPNGKKGIVQAPNANSCWSAAEADEVARAIGAAPPGSVLVLDCELPEEVTLAAARAAGEQGFTRLLDPSPADSVTDALLSDMEVVTPNASEAEALTGIAVKDAGSATQAARVLNRKGPPTVAVKLPKGGCVLLDDERLWRLGNGKVEPIDTTGAGDAFAGAMAVALLMTKDPVEAARWATAAANHAVTRWGAQAGLPDGEELEAALAAVIVEEIGGVDRAR